MESLPVPGPTSLSVLSITCISSAQCKHPCSCCCRVGKNYLAFQEIASTLYLYLDEWKFVGRMNQRDCASVLGPITCCYFYSWSCRRMILPISTAFAKHPPSGELACSRPLLQPQTPNPAQVFHRLSQSCKQLQPAARVFLLLPVTLFTVHVQHKWRHFVWDFFFH